VLSIGRIGGGQGDPRYYIDNVAKGREDYYSGQGEAEGEWYGSGAQAMNLSGTVGEDEFLGALSIDSDSRRSVLGFDLTFSAPKSVSLLYGIGDDRTARLARDAHDEAVKQALGYVERNACWTRRSAGRVRLRGDGMTIAMFRHRTSRAGDPQLHTHAVVANRTRAENRWGTLDSRALYAHARTAGFLYQAALREQITRTIGVEWEPVKNGLAEIRGFDREVLRHFSRRAEEIRAQLGKLGYRSARAAELATLETRRVKEYDVPVYRLREEWRARAAELGLGHDQLAEILDRRAPGNALAPACSAVASQLSSPGGLTRDASTFDRRDVLRDWAEAHREGAPVERIETLANDWLRSGAAIPVDASGSRRPGGCRYSTPEMLRLESELIELARARRGEGAGLADESAIGAVLAKRGMLSAEQLELAHSLTRSGDGIQVVCAPAGTGKTFALAAARDAWEASGTPVYGCALAARAAVELESLAGIDSTTIAQLRNDLDHGYGLPKGSVLIVDEAGMVGTRSIVELARHAAEVEAKLVLVGDDRQLPELDAGGAFRGVAERVGADRLHDARRQQHQWDREALAALRRGDVDAWAEAYRDRGRIVARPTAHAVRDAIVTDWWQAARRPATDAVMIAHSRADVGALNALARARMHEDGRLSDQELEFSDRRFAVGDRVLARRNDRRLGIVNGTRATVTALFEDRGAIEVEVVGGGRVEIDAPYLEDAHLDHGYALTAHAAQGATVDEAFVLGSDDLYREWGYTAMTRHREAARFYVVSPGSTERCLPGLEPDVDPIAGQLREMVGTSRRKELATEVLERGGPAGREAHDHAARQLTRTLDNLDALREQQQDVPLWRRSRRTELAERALAHEQAAARWREELDRFQPDPDPRGPRLPQPAVGADLDDLRASIADPSPALAAHIGARPAGLRDRDAWSAAARRLLDTSDPLDIAHPPEAGIELADVGLDL
jgi:conjugative relaxase-like TrwC/TraI family protein